MVSWKADMMAFRFQTRVLSAALMVGSLGVSSPSFAQGTGGTQPVQVKGLRVVELHPKPYQTPFPLDAKPGETRDRLDFLVPEQMTTADRNLAEANQGEIARRAELQGFNLERTISGEGSWGYEQAVCPVFPDHLILEYSRINGDGDVTLFSAVIPRGDGHVRVIPVRRRSYSLWTPSASNALTINDFNHMVQEGHEGLSPDWLTLGLCYAALAGGHVRAALVAKTPNDEVYPLFVPAKLTVTEKAGAEILFADVTPHSKAMDWVLRFDAKGRLLKVKHTVSAEILEKPVPGAPTEVTGPGHS
jgi:hypothetical protein